MEKSIYKPPFTLLFSWVGIAGGGWLGYRYNGGLGALLGVFLGLIVMKYYAAVAFAALLDDEGLRLKVKVTSRQYVRRMAIFYLIVAAVFIIFTPKSFRGQFLLGYADPFTPHALFLWSFLALVRLGQSRSPDYVFGRNMTRVERIFMLPLSLLGLLAIVAASMWHFGGFPTEIAR